MVEHITVDGQLRREDGYAVDCQVTRFKVTHPDGSTIVYDFRRCTYSEPLPRGVYGVFANGQPVTHDGGRVILRV